MPGRDQVDVLSTPPDDASVSYSFAFERRMDRWSRLFRVRPTNCSATLTRSGLELRFGRWLLATPWSNVVSVETTGPYRLWKVAGPARLSLRDRGITFATTTRRGVCIHFRMPVAALDPFAIIHHPNATVTVEDPDGFVAEAQRRILASPAPTAPGPSPRGTLLRSLSALRRWAERRGSVDVRRHDVGKLRVPPAADDLTKADAQPISGGTGAWFHRRYSIRVRHPKIDAAAAMRAIQSDPNVLIDDKLAPLSKSRGVHNQLAEGDRYIVETAGPWSGPVEVVEVTDHSFRLATLEGHMEAGLIQFSITPAGDEVELTIESWNRSSGALVDVLYDHLSVAQDLQSEMWVQACERFEALAGGNRVGPVSVVTERAPHGAASVP